MPTTSPSAPGANPFEQARLAARELARLTGVDGHDVAVVLGTGMHALAEGLGATGPPVDLTALPWFTRFTGPGHRPEAWSVEIGRTRVLVVAGRLHLYEARSPAEVVHTVRTAIAAGVRRVILTCSAGSIRAGLSVGQVVAIEDHLNLSGMSPLVGLPANGAPGSRHVNMTDAWSPRLRSLARGVTDIQGVVYAHLLGPELETPAEIRMLAALGADVVGMSTVPEAIAARHLGAEVLGLCVVTNAAAGSAGDATTAASGLDIESISRVADGAVPTLSRIVLGVVGALEDA